MPPSSVKIIVSEVFPALALFWGSSAGDFFCLNCDYKIRVIRRCLCNHPEARDVTVARGFRGQLSSFLFLFWRGHIMSGSVVCITFLGSYCFTFLGSFCFTFLNSFIAFPRFLLHHCIRFLLPHLSRLLHPQSSWFLLFFSVPTVPLISVPTS